MYTYALVRTDDDFVVAETYTRKDMLDLLATDYIHTCGCFAPTVTAADYTVRKIDYSADTCDGCDGADEDYAVLWGMCSECGRPISRDYFSS